MIKPIDMSVLPDGMLIEVVRRDWTVGQWISALTIKKNAEYDATSRPALNHWHHNDGTMTLPDGLVVELVMRSGEKLKGYTATKGIPLIHVIDDFTWITSLEHSDPREVYFTLDIIAVKILGVTAEYGSQLGMEVIEL